LRSGTGQSSFGSMLVKGGISLNEIFLVLGNIVDGMNRVGGASRNTGATVDTTLGIHIHLSGRFETGFVLLGWTQSVGQTSTQRESLMQESLIT
jgi:hypothetical protein